MMLLEPLQLPQSVKVDETTYTPTYGMFEIGPLEPGFATTVGNTLRRVLLSSIQGVAVRFVKIEGIHHEFAAIPGATSDFVDLILQIKKLVITKDEMGDDLVVIEKTGPCVITAADIAENHGIKVINKDLKLLELTEDTDFHMELWVGVGRGFVPAENQILEDSPVGVIPIDSIFSPIVKVNFETTHQRVKKRIDFDKLVVEISTNGAIDPHDALFLSAKLLKDLYSTMVLFKQEPEYIEEVEMDPELKRLEKLIDMNVGDLELSVRSSNCLSAAKIVYIYELVGKTESQMLKYRNFGKKSFEEIEIKLNEYGLALDMDVMTIRKDIENAKKRLKTNIRG